MKSAHEDLWLAVRDLQGHEALEAAAVRLGMDRGVLELVCRRRNIPITAGQVRTADLDQLAGQLQAERDRAEAATSVDELVARIVASSSLRRR